jgi:hypothetical protein
MDWVLEHQDPVSGRKIRIAPRDNIRKCITKEDIECYGPYWSPWLETQYRQLQQKGEGHLFKQEVLAEFLGSGGTIIPVSVLRHIGANLKKYTPRTFDQPLTYIHPVTGESEIIDLRGPDSRDGLWIWDEPIMEKPPLKAGPMILRQAEPAHTYVIGADTATGQNNDFSTLEVFDLDTMEQVAEFMGRLNVSTFSKIADHMGRWYNNAILCAESTGIGASLIEDLQLLNYPNLWRRRKTMPNGQIQYGNFGYPTSEASKPALNKIMVEYLSDKEGEGYTIKSERLWHQMQIYIRRRNKQGFDTSKTGAQSGKGNHDDLVIAMALAFTAAVDAIDPSNYNLLPCRSSKMDVAPLVDVNRAVHQSELVSNNDRNILMPFTMGSNIQQDVSQQAELEKFMGQMTSASQLPQKAVVIPKNYLRTRK